ncbi:hypothetical protein EDB85DRAFT_1885903 [Lactarius pseudohatsudake]|nr:hypothetical protein EDB85DRAFT_1885903 [Lactarius pseudohatsudake]
MVIRIKAPLWEKPPALARVDQLWYKYVYLEELLQNIAVARQIFERWMAWEPDDMAWQAYIKLEIHYNELDRTSAIYERWVAVRPEPRIWVKWGKCAALISKDATTSTSPYAPMWPSTPYLPMGPVESVLRICGH